jgi:hypothetical protein
MVDSTIPAPVRFADLTEITATLEEVDIKTELQNRPHRRPDYEAEHRALGILAREMAENPKNMLQKLVEVAVELCNAGTAGISLVEGPTLSLGSVGRDIRLLSREYDAFRCQSVRRVCHAEQYAINALARAPFPGTPD